MKRRKKKEEKEQRVVGKKKETGKEESDHFCARRVGGVDREFRKSRLTVESASGADSFEGERGGGSGS